MRAQQGGSAFRIRKGDGATRDLGWSPRSHSRRELSQGGQGWRWQFWGAGTQDGSRSRGWHSRARQPGSLATVHPLPSGWLPEKYGCTQDPWGVWDPSQIPQADSQPFSSH